MELIQDNTITTIHFTEDQSVRDKVEEFLYDNLAAEVPGAQFSPQVKRGFWDGMVHFYDKKEHSFATGLTKDVTTLLEKVRFTYEFTFEVVDNRPDRFVNQEDIPNEITLGGMTLRDYQMNAVKELFESGQGGIANLSVSAGKTLIGATVVDLVLERLQKGERIAFFTNNKEIFRQNIENLNKFLPEKVGYLGGGKKKIARVMVCMIPTVDSYLKIDPEAGLKFSPKEQQVKKMAKTYAPQFIYEEHPYQAFKSFVSLFKPVKKVDYTTQETLEDIRDSCGSDKDVVNIFKSYIAQYDKLVEKKASDSVKKKKFITDLLDSFVLFVADECITGDTLVQLEDLSFKRAKDIQVGDNLAKGGHVTHLKKTHSETITLVHNGGEITATPTHPIAVLEDGKIAYKPVMTVKIGDKLLYSEQSLNDSLDINHILNTEDGKIAYLVGMLYADGTFLRNKKGDKHSNTIRVNISKEEQFDWYRKTFKDGINALCNKYGVTLPEGTIVDKLDSRDNLLLRVTNADVANLLYDEYELPFGKKSSVIKLPSLFLDTELSLAFFSAVISCEGTVSKENSPRLVVDMCSRRMINDMLTFFNTLGIHGYHTVKHDPRYSRSEVYRASFPVGYRWASVIPSGAPKHDAMQKNKDTHFKEQGSYILSPVKDIKFGSKEDMFDFTTENHVFVADGLLNHNCHHSKADTWYRVLLSCRNAIYKVGLSGSIDKDDPIVTTRLRGVFGGIVAKVGSKELVDRGILAKPTIVMIPINEPSTLAAVSTKGNGWQKIYKLGIEENEYRNTLIAGITKKQYESGKSTLIIVNRINQADIIGAYLDALGIPHEFINGQQDDDERKAELSRVASGENRVLLSTSVLDEGVDISNIDTLILAAGGKSMRQVIQRIGRVLRKKKNKENKATIFDFEDNENQALRKHTKERLAIYKEQEFDVKYVGR